MLKTRSILMLCYKNLFCFCAFVLSLLASYNAEGQLIEKAQVAQKIKLLPQAYLGAKMGANFSYLSSNNWNNGVKSNALYGAFAGVRGARFGVQIEGVFEQSDYTTGATFYDLYQNYYRDLKDSLTQGTFRLNKLCLPIFLQFRVARLIWLQTGVQFYGVVNVKDNNALLRDAKMLYKKGNSAALLGAAIRIGNASIGARFLFDFNNLNNLNSQEVWRQYLFQTYVGVRIF